MLGYMQSNFAKIATMQGTITETLYTSTTATTVQRDGYDNVHKGNLHDKIVTYLSSK